MRNRAVAGVVRALVVSTPADVDIDGHLMTRVAVSAADENLGDSGAVARTTPEAGWVERRDLNSPLAVDRLGRHSGVRWKVAVTSWGPDIVTVQAGFVPEHDPSDFGYGDLSVRGVPAVGQRPLLTILVDYKE